jgi:hypothetical protein
MSLCPTGAEAAWKIICLEGGTVVSQQVVKSADVDAVSRTMGMANPTAICVASSDEPSSAPPPAQSVAPSSTMGPDDLLSAIQALSGGVPVSLPPQVTPQVASPMDDSMAAEPEAVVPSAPPPPAHVPEVALGYVRVGKYRGMDLQALLDEVGRLRGLSPTLSSAVPAVLTVKDESALDFGPLSASEMSRACMDVSATTGRCETNWAVGEALDLPAFLSETFPGFFTFDDRWHASCRAQVSISCRRAVADDSLERLRNAVLRPRVIPKPSPRPTSS